ncbi:MAG: Ig-like domain-containing protein, partial [Bacteroidales bacterium]
FSAPLQPVEAATVNLCFNKTLNGANIQGLLNGAVKNVWGGVFEVTLESAIQHAFCTDIKNGISQGCYSNSELGVTAPKVACTLQYYPPDTTVSNEEAASRQAAVWYFSDAYVTTGPTGIKTRSDAIIQDIETKYAAGSCSTVVNPTLNITPTTAVNFLADDGAGGYLPSGHDFTVTLLRGTAPLSNQAVSISATNGATINGGVSPQTVTTDASGKVTFTISHSVETTSEITASAIVSLPVGTRVDPGTNKQKIVLTGSQNFTVSAKASKTRQAGSKLILKKFHDRNRNGQKDNENEEWLAWTVYVREHQADQTLPPSASWTSYTTTTQEASPLTLGVDPASL